MFEKLDAYNLVANLVPGAALTYALHFSNFPTPAPENLGAFLLVAFVAGVTANRLGSLLLDPLLRWTKFLKPKDYPSFLNRERQDSKLDSLVANSGLYRTFFMSGGLYLLALSLSSAANRLTKQELFVVLIVVGMGVFLFALRKEDKYIFDRVQVAKVSNEVPPADPLRG